LHDARTANEVLKAQESRLRLEERKGKLVDKARALLLVHRLAKEEREAIVAWPARVAAEMAAEHGVDVHRLQTMMDTRLREGNLVGASRAGDRAGEGQSGLQVLHEHATRRGQLRHAATIGGDPGIGMIDQGQLPIPPRHEFRAEAPFIREAHEPCGLGRGAWWLRQGLRRQVIERRPKLRILLVQPNKFLVALGKGRIRQPAGCDDLRPILGDPPFGTLRQRIRRRAEGQQRGQRDPYLVGRAAARRGEAQLRQPEPADPFP
jgi:hypothetical protein